LRLAKGNYRDILVKIEEIWNEVNDGMTFEFSFLDERLNQQYLSEEKTNKLFIIFAAMSIFVACLGLFGLAAFTTEEKTKEIGVRKVLGASIPLIFIDLVKQFTKWVLLANIIAWPLAYYIISRWLEVFAYRIQIDIWPYIIAAFLAFIIAVGTVSYQAVKAALANPVDSLKYE
jgi:putative ABC transport system permease protein